MHKSSPTCFDLNRSSSSGSRSVPR